MQKIKQNFVSLKTILRKEIVRILRIWPQTLLPPVITMSLYFIIFGSLIGSRVGEMGGFDYMKFIVPGVIMMAIITNSYMNTSSSFFGNKFGKNIEELLVSPTSNWVIILGFVCGGVFRGLLIGIIVTFVSLFFTHLAMFNILVVISSVVLTSVLFSLAGMLNGIYARKFDDVTIIPTFVLTPLTYLGGVFYSIQLLPQFWQNVSLLNPILYMVNLFRYGFLGVSDINIFVGYVMILIFIGVFFTWCLYLLKKGHGMRN
jgi:ABC-2 type transport system permease protein